MDTRKKLKDYMKEKKHGATKTDKRLELIKSNWSRIQEWVCNTYCIAPADYRTEIIPMIPERMNIDEHGKCVVSVRLYNTDRYLDTYIERRYAGFFAYAVRELLYFDCSFTFEADGYKSDKRLFHRWISGITLLVKGQKKENRYEYDEDLNKAMTLFMIKDISGIDETFLRKQRNRLIKAFHPDEDNCSHEYAAEINRTYELLCRYAKEH